MKKNSLIIIVLYTLTSCHAQQQIIPQEEPFQRELQEGLAFLKETKKLLEEIKKIEEDNKQLFNEVDKSPHALHESYYLYNHYTNRSLMLQSSLSSPFTYVDQRLVEQRIKKRIHNLEKAIAMNKIDYEKYKKYKELKLLIENYTKEARVNANKGLMHISFLMMLNKAYQESGREAVISTLKEELRKFDYNYLKECFKFENF